jgi:hypothetical protein
MARGDGGRFRLGALGAGRLPRLRELLGRGLNRGQRCGRLRGHVGDDPGHVPHFAGQRAEVAIPDRMDLVAKPHRCHVKVTAGPNRRGTKAGDLPRRPVIPHPPMIVKPADLIVRAHMGDDVQIAGGVGELDVEAADALQIFIDGVRSVRPMLAGKQ